MGIRLNIPAKKYADTRFKTLLDEKKLRLQE